MKLTTLILVFVSLVACTKQIRPPIDPRNVDGPVDCAAGEFKAHEKCFAKAREACDSLACPSGCDIHRSRTSKWITCSSNRSSSSMMVRCGGIANWQCPENTVCGNDPTPGHCTHESARDCTGLCIAKSGEPLARCDGYSGWSCPEGTTCANDPRPGACNREKDDDCAGICVPTRP